MSQSLIEAFPSAAYVDRSTRQRPRPAAPRLLAYPEGFRAVKRSRQARSERRHASAQTRQ